MGQLKEKHIEKDNMAFKPLLLKFLILKKTILEAISDKKATFYHDL